MVGTNVQNKASINSVYICPQCLLLLRNPVQLMNCGHRMCQSCIDEQEHDQIHCAECQVRTTHNKLKPDRGVRNDMQTLLINCILCNWTGTLKIYQDHLDQCHPNPICEYCEQQFTSIYDLDGHKQYTCEKISIYCPLKQYGCQDMILRIHLHEHYSSEQHQQTLINVVHHMKSPSRSSSMIVDRLPTNPTMHFQEVDETLNVLSDGMETLTDDLQRLTTESLQQQNALDALEKDLPRLKLSIQEQNAFLDGIKLNQEVLEQDIQSMHDKRNNMKDNSYDGTFIWKISNVQAKLTDAQSQKQTSFYSPPFYSSPTGYKMCLRMYMHGDGNARGTHISLFFVLMRGEYDAILKFPFYYKVILCLYDQISNKNHIIDSFRPDIKSNSFQRPRTDMNVASGIPKFAPLTIFQQENNPYVRDDTMFIKAIVDFNDTSKTLLSYALSLNPGLPTTIHATMIRQESDKRQQQSSAPSTSTTINIHME